MGFEANIIDKKYFRELVNADDFASNLSLFDTFLKTNMGERMQAKMIINVSWNSLIDDAVSGKWTATNVGGASTITRQTGSWIDDGFAIGDVCDFFEGVGGLNTSDLVVTNVEELVIYLDANIAFATTGGGTDSTIAAELKGKNALNGVNYSFGFPLNNGADNTISRTDSTNQLYKSLGVNTASPSFVPGIYSSNFPTSNIESFQVRHIQTIATYTQQFEFEHIFFTKAWYAEGQFDNLQNGVFPLFLEEANTIRHFFRIKFGATNADNPNEQKIFEFSNFDGDVGWFDENFNQGSPQFELDSITFNDTIIPANLVTGLQIDRDTDVTILIGRNNPFLDMDDDHFASIHVSYLPNFTEQSLNFNDFKTNWVYESIVNQRGAGTKSEGFISDYEITTIGGGPDSQLQLKFTVSYSMAEQIRLAANDRRFLIWAVVRDLNDNNGKSRTPVRCAADIYLRDDDIRNLMTMTEPLFYNHGMDVTSSLANTNMDGHVQDDFLVKFSFTLDRNLGAYLKEFSMLISAFNSITEAIFDIVDITFNFVIVPVTGASPQIINVNGLRGFKIPNSELFNQININFEPASFTAGIATYNVSIGFKAGWMDYLPLVGVPDIFFNSLLPNNGQHQKINRYSGVNDYALKFGIRANVFDQNGIETAIGTIYEFLSGDLIIRDWDEGSAGTLFGSGNVIVENGMGQDTNGLAVIGDDNVLKIVFVPSPPLDPAKQWWGEIFIELFNNGGYDALNSLSTLRLYGSGVNPLEAQTISGFVDVTNTGSLVTLICDLNTSKLVSENPGVQYLLTGRIEPEEQNFKLLQDNNKKLLQDDDKKLLNG